MADNLETQAGSGGPLVATDEIAGVHYPRTKLVIGADGVNGGDVSAANPLPITAADLSVAPTGAAVAYWPAYMGPTSTERRSIGVDEGGALVTRGAVTTDEGTFRVNFANTSIAVTLGTVTRSGRVITGTGFGSADVHEGDYFKFDADADTSWMQIASIDSDTQLTLAADYTGASSGAASRALVFVNMQNGAGYSVASGQLTVTSGTTSGASGIVGRVVDYAPLVFRCAVSISQRIANQETRIGFAEPTTGASPRWFARFNASGTTNTTIICESARNPTTAPSASETQSTTVTLPNGATTATINDYRVEILTESVRFYINKVLVAEHVRVLPSQSDIMAASVRIVNTGTAASSTSVVLDYMTTKNHNKLEIGIMSDSEQIVVQQPDLVPFAYSLAGVIAINTVLLNIDCLRFRSLSIQAVSIGTTGVVTPEWSNDGTNWVAATITTAAGATATTLNAAGLWQTPVFARYFRLRLSTATTAGTTTLAVAAYSQGAALLPTQPVSGSVTVSGTVTASGTVGTAAEDAAASGNPVMAAGVARTANAPTTLVAGDVVRHTMTSGGALVVKQYAPMQVEFAASLALTTTTAAQIVAAGAAGIRNHLTSFWAINTGGAVVDLIILDGATERARYPLPINAPVPVTFPTGLLTTAATALNANLSAAGTVRANFTGYTSA